METKASVLVVDDDADSQEMFTVLPENEGYDVRTPGNGAEALTSLAEGRPPVIPVDLIMPLMSDDELRQREVADRRFKDVPVSDVTAEPDGHDRAAGMDTDAHIQKPFNSEWADSDDPRAYRCPVTLNHGEVLARNVRVDRTMSICRQVVS